MWLRGDRAGAKQTARLAIDAGRDRHDPEPRAWVLTQASMIFWQEGDFDGADAGFDKTLEWMVEFPPALVGKGRVAMAKGDPKRAAEYFKRAWDQSPLVETAWLLGDARAASGDAKGAEEAYAKVRTEGRRVDPRTLSMFYSARNENTDEALRLAEEEYKVRKDIATEDARAWALYRAGRIADAKQSIEKARRLGTPDARLMYHEGAIKMAAGDKAGGRKLIEAAIALNPAFDWKGAEEAKKALAAK
jgi:tetratricopeptide (TPR) repeat protein